MCYAVSQPDDFVADELCFVPQGDRCDILSIRTNGWQRHHGDHRRSLVEILNNLAAAVACGKLRILDDGEARGGDPGRDAWSRSSRSPTRPRSSARESRWTRCSSRPASTTSTASAPSSASPRPSPTCCCTAADTATWSSAASPDRLRFVVADEGPGLNFLNWIEPPSKGGQASMGYGFKIILDYLDAVALHTGPTGTTLLLDRMTN